MSWEREHVENIKQNCKPESLDKDVLQLLRIVITTEASLKDARQGEELAKRFLNEAYEDMSSRQIDAPCFNSRDGFFMQMMRETIAKAQEYAVDKRADMRLPPRDNFGDKGRFLRG